MHKKNRSYLTIGCGAKSRVALAFFSRKKKTQKITPPVDHSTLWMITHNMLTNMSFPQGEGWEIPECCLLVGKTVWDAFQDLPKEKSRVFLCWCCWEWMESRLLRLCLSCLSKALIPLIFLGNKQAFKLGTPGASISLLLSLFIKSLILRKLIFAWIVTHARAYAVICDLKCGASIAKIKKKKTRIYMLFFLLFFLTRS